MGKESKDFLGRVESRWALAREFGAIPVLGGAATGVFAMLTNFMSAWSPLSYFAAAVIGAILFQLWVLLNSASAERQERKRRVELLSAPKGQINPLLHNFENQRVYLSDLLPPLGKVIKRKTLRNCEIVGPANVFFAGIGQLSNSGFIDVDGIITDEDASMYNCVVLESCHITDCRFFEVTVIMTPEMYVKFKGELLGMNWINEGVLDAKYKGE